MSTHNLTDLAALIITDVIDEEFPENGYLTILVWQDCSTRIIFPSGSKMNVSAFSRDLDATIKVALGSIHHHCLEVGREAQISVHKVPANLTTEEQILAWIQSVPGIVLGFGFPERMGFGGPLPPAGQAG
jgi:hypothetical protein